MHLLITLRQGMWKLLCSLPLKKYISYHQSLCMRKEVDVNSDVNSVLQAEALGLLLAALTMKELGWSEIIFLT